MSYMDRLTGSMRTNAPVVPVARIDSRLTGQRAAATMACREEDSAAFREMRALMHQSYGFCG